MASNQIQQDLLDRAEAWMNHQNPKFHNWKLGAVQSSKRSNLQQEGRTSRGVAGRSSGYGQLRYLRKHDSVL
jgi:hypothetical protein